jgi:hypothetical protein
MDKELKAIVDKLKEYKEDMPLKYTDYQNIEKIIGELEVIEPKRILLEVPTPFTDKDKLLLITSFHEWYYNTDQNDEVYAEEYYSVVDDIMHNQVPVKLLYLTDYIDLLIDLFPGLEYQIKKRLEETVC